MTEKRLLLLSTTTGYQTHSFVEAAKKIGVKVAFGTDRCHVLEDPWHDGALPLHFENPDQSALQIVDYARSNPVDAVAALGDRTAPTAARACHALNLLFHSPEATDVCRDKYRARERLRVAGLNVPHFIRFALNRDPRTLVETGRLLKPSNGETTEVSFPCVLKPLSLSASRGVIRADTPEQFVQAFDRIHSLLNAPDVKVMREDTSNFLQVEGYVEGVEIAVEGLMDRGQLKVLAIFDKPDPLVGPFFEETLYVTPSRLPSEVQAEVVETLRIATGALGLYHGPLHAELRVNPQGVWVLEVAARSIGGLCSRTLRFSSPRLGESLSLEELLIGLALGDNINDIAREKLAAGVMMIPIPEAGVFREVQGLEAALQTQGVDDIRITAKQNQKLVPLPEGCSYLGFIFARGSDTAFVETALRQAHGRLRFTVTPALPVIKS